MVRKGLRRHELYAIFITRVSPELTSMGRKVIPILYLPKSTPLQHHLPSIPRLLGRLVEPPNYSGDRVKTTKLTALWQKGACPDKSKNVYVSMLW